MWFYDWQKDLCRGDYRVVLIRIGWGEEEVDEFGVNYRGWKTRLLILLGQYMRRLCFERNETS